MKVKKYVYILSFLVFIILWKGIKAADNESNQRPNIILIVADDLGYKDLTSYESDLYETPNIDRLGQKGAMFTNSYAAASVCSPTRASIMTGNYPATLHLTEHLRYYPYESRASDKVIPPEIVDNLPLEEVTIAEVLKEAGYVTAHIGKWHLGGEGYLPTDQGFDINLGGKRSGMPGSYFYPFKSKIFEYPELEKIAKEGDYLTDVLTREAVQFIENNRENPFFLYLPYFIPHTPIEAKATLVDKYVQKLRDKPALNHNDPTYAAMIETLDENVGKVMRSLEYRGIDDNTMVIFISDNGGVYYEAGGLYRDSFKLTSQAPLRSGKGYLYEGGIRVPLLITWPGVIEEGSVIHEPVISNDLFPTIVNMVNKRDDQDFNEMEHEGENLMPLLLGTQDKLKRKQLFWHSPHYTNQGAKPSGAIRSGKYKLIDFYEDGRLELYNLKEDVSEKNNLVDEKPEITQRLHEALKNWRQKVNAQMPKPNPDYQKSQK
ncbi:sulfatase [Halalkalibaculum sp. DA384]|uniref:sulfatase n=1 Tax=Halalkalibaculum sp. DA384 TaxID=3373606 RepID=UPI003754E566